LCPHALFISLCRIEVATEPENFSAIFLLPLVSAEGAFRSARGAVQRLTVGEQHAVL
jgi:hypothetical protein